MIVHSSHCLSSLSLMEKSPVPQGPSPPSPVMASPSTVSCWSHRKEQRPDVIRGWVLEDPEDNPQLSWSSATPGPNIRSQSHGSWCTRGRGHCACPLCGSGCIPGWDCPQWQQIGTWRREYTCRSCHRAREGWPAAPQSGCLALAGRASCCEEWHLEPSEQRVDCGTRSQSHWWSPSQQAFRWGRIGGHSGGNRKRKDGFHYLQLDWSHSFRPQLKSQHHSLFYLFTCLFCH